MRYALFGGDFTQRRLTVSCRRFGTTVGGVEIRTAVLVKIQVIWDVSPCRLVNLPAPSGPTAQDVTFFIPSVPGERKSLHHFHMFVFLGGHFNAFGVLEHVMNAVAALRSTETSVTLHQSTGRNLHQHLCENVMSQIRTPCRAKLLCDESFTDVKIIAAFTKAPQWTYFSFHAL